MVCTLQNMHFVVKNAWHPSLLLWVLIALLRTRASCKICTFCAHIQGHPERMRKVNCLWKSQFSQKNSFLNCFRSEIGGKFMPYSIQVHQNHPEASLEAGASGVLSDSGWLAQADHWPEILSKGPNHVFLSSQGEKISNINIFISIHTTNLSFTNWNTNFGSLLRVSKSVVGLKQPITARKHIKGASL